MSDLPHRDPRHDAGAEFDPANAALSDALRRSFGLLKWLMIFVVVFYAFSGMFRVEPGEVGFVLRMGDVIHRDLGEGWHWAWPFPIDEARTMSRTRDGAVTASFMFQFTEDQLAKGVKSGGASVLRPGRDAYLVTGDLNVVHANLTAQYVINSAIDYLTNIRDPSPEPADKNPPEHEILRDMLAAATVEVSAERGINGVYGDRGGFQDAVRDRMRQRLKTLADSGAPLGIEVRAVIGQTKGAIEPILPPLAVMAEFEAVQSAEAKKVQTITEADSKAQELLSLTCGPDYAALADAIDAEFLAQREKRADLTELRRKTEELLNKAAGQVRAIIQGAESYRDRIVQEAGGDASRVTSLAPEYNRNPALVESRLRWGLLEELFSNDLVAKKYVPDSLREVRLVIPRDAEQQESVMQRRKLREKEEAEGKKSHLLDSSKQLRPFATPKQM